MIKTGRSIPFALLIVGSLFLSDALQAQTSENVLDGVIEMYRDTANAWRPIILAAATRLFWILVGIDFVWTGINLALEQADFSKIVGELIKRIMVIGFYFALIIHSGEWSQAIIDSFRDLASAANASAGGIDDRISPSNIFDLGLRIAGTLSDQVTFSEIGESIARVITAIIVMISFAMIAGLLLVALVELYIALNAAVILLAFGGSRWTSEYANKYLAYILSVGIKIFVMQLLIGIGQSFITKFSASYEGNNSQSLIFLGASIVLLMIVKTIPDYLQSIVSGISPGSAGSSLLAGAAAAGGAAIGGAAGAATAGTGGAMAVMEAAKLTSSQMGGGGSNGKASLGGLVMGTMKNLGSSAIGDAAGKMSGNLSHQHGSMGARMASRMKEERLSLAPPEEPSEQSKQGADTKKPKQNGIPTLSDFDDRRE